MPLSGSIRWPNDNPISHQYYLCFYLSFVHYQQKPPIFYQRLNQVLEDLIEFFCVDGIGIPRDKMMTDEVNVRNTSSLSICDLKKD